MIENITKDAIIDVVYFCMEKVLLYWSMVQYNNVQEKDRIARKSAMLPDGGTRLTDGYIISLVPFCYWIFPESIKDFYGVFDLLGNLKFLGKQKLLFRNIYLCELLFLIAFKNNFLLISLVKQ